MKHLRKSVHLNEREITELLRGPEKCFQRFSGAIVVLDRASLKESLEQALELAKTQNDLEHVELFKNVLCNFDQITFYVEFADENSIVYSFRSKSNCGEYYVKDSVFFTLPK